MRMEKRLERLTALILAGLVLMLSAGFFIGEKKVFSENENRYLASFPHFSPERVVSGAYMEDWNSWLADQFPFRDFFVGAKTDTETALGKKEINGVFIAEDGYLIEEYREPANTERIAGTLRKFAGELGEGQPEPKLMLVPTAFLCVPGKAAGACALERPDGNGASAVCGFRDGGDRLQPRAAHLRGGKYVLQDGSSLDHVRSVPGVPGFL